MRISLKQLPGLAELRVDTPTSALRLTSTYNRDLSACSCMLGTMDHGHTDYIMFPFLVHMDNTGRVLHSVFMERLAAILEAQ